MELLDFPTGDINAAQVDVKNLNLEQLLHIRCENIDFQVTSPALKTQADFLAAADGMIEKRICERLAAGGVGAWWEQSRINEVARSVLLIYGVYDELGGAQSKSDFWLLRLPRLEALLCISSCELQPIQTASSDGEAKEEKPAWVHRNMSRASAAVVRSKKQLHWEVELHDRPSEFKDTTERTLSRNVRGAAFEQRLAASGGRAAGVAVNDVQARGQARLAAERAAADPRFQEALERATNLEIELAAAKEEAAKRIASLQEELRSAKEEATADEKGAEAVVLELEEKMKQQKSSLEASETKLKEMEDLLHAKTSEAEEMDEKLKEQSEALAAVEPKVLAAEAKSEELASRVSDLEEQIHKEQDERAAVKTAHDELDEKVKVLDAQKEELSTSLGQLDEKVKEVQCSLEASEEEAKKSAAQVADLQQQLEQEQSEKSKFEQKIKEVEDSAAAARVDLEKNVDELKTSLQDAESAAAASREQAEAAEAKCAASSTRFAELEERLQAQEANADAEDIQVSENKASATAPAERLSELENEIKALQDSGCKSKEARAKLEEQVQKLNELLESSDANAKAATDAKVSAEAKADAAEAKISELEQKLQAQNVESETLPCNNEVAEELKACQESKSALEKRVAELEESLKTQEEQILQHALDTMMETAEAQKNAAEKKLVQQTAAIEKAENQCKELQSALDSSEQKVQSMRDEVRRLKEALASAGEAKEEKTPLRDVEDQQQKNAEQKELGVEVRAEKRDEAKDDTGSLSPDDESKDASCSHREKVDGTEPKDTKDSGSKPFEPEPRVKLDRAEAKLDDSPSAEPLRRPAFLPDQDESPSRQKQDGGEKDR